MFYHSSNLYQRAQIRALEQIAVDQFALSEQQLMANAGKAAFMAMHQHWPHVESVAVLAGKGNNAGDGYVVARLAKEEGMQVTVYAMAPPETLSGPAKAAALACQEAGVLIEIFTPKRVLEEDLIVDALLGTGLKGEVKGVYRQVIEAINQLETPVLSIDLPSGLDVDTGVVLGDAIRADLTVTFIGVNQGLLMESGPDYCNALLCDDLELPEAAFAQVKPASQRIDEDDVRECLPERERTANKGDFGHVLVIGGDYGMPGATRMAAEAAGRVGAGLVSVATHPEHVAVVSGQCPEVMCHGVEKAEDLLPLIERATTLVVGPGLGRSKWSEAVLAVALAANKPLVVDADGLNGLVTMSLHRNDWILTPHPGEAARLLHCSCGACDIQADRFSAVHRLQKKYGGACVLKGAGTLVLSDEGTVNLCDAGNPGMATGGMGDVLSGVIGGLLAQGLSIENAAKVGVYIHARAGDLAAKAQGERGLLATDLLPYLSQVIN